MTKEEIAYLAGFFDGEGNIYISHRKNHSRVIRFSIGQSNYEVLKWIQKDFGGGITKRKPKENRLPFWTYYLERGKVLPLLRLLLPHLKVKRNMVLDALEQYKDYEANYKKYYKKPA